MKKQTFIAALLLIAVLSLSFKTPSDDATSTDTTVAGKPPLTDVAETEDTVALVPRALAIPYLDALENEIVVELNLARQNPGAYADYLESTLPYYRGTNYSRPGEITIVTREGAAAVREAIAFLRRQTPIAPLSPSPGLSHAAQDHADDQAATGALGHSGRDGSTPYVRMNRYGTWSRAAGENVSYGPSDAREIVGGLIVDDGVANRGHRASIYNAAYLIVGVGTGPHSYGTMCVIDYAGAYAERP